MKADFAVIGGGVIGLASAYELARQGATVVVLERGGVGAESSWAGGGILFPLLPWDYGEPVTRLTQWSGRLYPEWVVELQARTGIDPEYRVSGMVVLDAPDPAGALAWCAAHGEPAERVEVRRVMPDCGPGGEGLWLPAVAQVRNPRLVKALARRLELEGVRIVERAEASRIHVAGNRVTGVETPRGTFTAGTYVVAAGAWSRIVLGELAPTLPIAPVRGQMLLFKTDPGRLAPIVLRHGVYLIPRGDGHILAGSTLEEVGFDKGTTPAVAARLHAAAAEIFPPLAALRPVRHWAGLRPGSPGNVPVIARHPSVENLYLNSGHFRYGVTMAPGSARLLGNLLAGGEQPFDVSPYRWPG